jgi:alpha-amylase
VNIFVDYETFGEHQWMESGIFEFLSALPGFVYKNTNFSFNTPSEVAANLLPISTINVPFPISWADEERDLTAWLGNELQVDAFNKLYALTEKVHRIEDEKVKKDWNYLQSSDHLYYMSTKFFSDGATQAYFNPYDTPYEAYINYMNVLSDFSIRVNTLVPDNACSEEMAGLSRAIAEKDSIISSYEAEIKRLKALKTKPAKAGSKTAPRISKSKTISKLKSNPIKARKK